MDQLTISSVPEDILAKVNLFNLHMPRACYTNCMQLMVHFAKTKSLEYVLVKALHKSEQIPVDHAILKRGDCYFDPTLEKQGLVGDTKYFLVKAFSFQDIADSMMARYGAARVRNMVFGAKPLCILIPDGNGGFAFEP